MAVEKSSRESRIREAYARRDSSGRPKLYWWHRPEVRVAEATRTTAAVELLADAGITDLWGLRIVDVGCGRGDWLARLVSFGADPARLLGVDLLRNRVASAFRRWPMLNWIAGSGWELPLRRRTADLVCAFTVFSSITEAAGRRALASEMARVTRRGGVILIYDFRISRPDNPDTVGIGASTMRQLFPGWEARSRTVTLAPPLARALARLSAASVFFAEAALPFLRTHRMYLLRDMRDRGPSEDGRLSVSTVERSLDR